MEFEAAYIAISLVALFVVAVLVFFVKGNMKKQELSTLAKLAFGFILAGTIFGDERIIGYSLMGIGIILAVADIYLKKKK